MSEPVQLVTGTAGIIGFDSHRGRMRLGMEHMAVIGQLRTGSPARDLPPDIVDQLTQIGLLDQAGTLDPAAAEMSQVVADAEVMIDVETSCPTGIVRHGISLAAEAGTPRAWARASWPDDPISEFLPLDPGLIVPWIAQTVGLQHDPNGHTETRRPLTAPLHAAEQAIPLTRDDPGAARRVLTSAGVAPNDADRLATVLAAVRCGWRVTTQLLISEHDTRWRSLPILDAGPEGLWQRTSPTEPIGHTHPDPDTPFTIEPRTPAHVWNALTDLLDLNHAPHWPTNPNDKA